MRPWQHARSSAAGTGRHWSEDLAIHELMDATKCAYAGLRHRIVLHNADIGPALAERAFPGRADARAIALRHVREDTGHEPTISHWLDSCDKERLPQPMSRRRGTDAGELAGMIAQAQGVAVNDGPAEVIALLMMPTTLAGDRALPVLMNSAGPMLMRMVLGPPRVVAGATGRDVVFDAALAAEAAINWMFGRIPQLGEVASAMRSHQPQQRVKEGRR